MSNVLVNSSFKEMDKEGILNFKKSDNVSLDDFYLRSNKTCSVTTFDGETAFIEYVPAINLNNNKVLKFGLKIRAINCNNLNLVVVFLDSQNEEVKTLSVNVSSLVKYNFKKLTKNFEVPVGATQAKVQVQFLGKTIACSFLKPFVKLK